MWDGAFGDRVYDGAEAVTLGPDGTFFPAGIYRGLDFPNPWCGAFLDFTPGGVNQPQTPGAVNPSCPNAAVGNAGDIVEYCTAGTTTNNCVALITASANPSVSLANACVISARNVEGGKTG